MSQGTTAVAAALGVTTVAHLVARVTDADAVATATQWLLMPLLAAAVWLAAGPGRRSTRIVRLVVVALLLSWLGDSAPDVVPSGVAFETKLGFFLLAHVAYLAAFWPLRGEGVAVRRPMLVAAYAAAFVVIVGVCAPDANGLLIPVVVYAATLSAMAVLATFDRLAAIGGVAFMVSDSLIALNAFVDGFDLPQYGFWVMVTYVGAQVLIALGALRAASRPAVTSPDGLLADPGSRLPVH